MWVTLFTKESAQNERSPEIFDDLAGVAGGAMSALAGLREEIAAAVRARVDETVRRMDLIKRDEFEAMAELARRAREQADRLELRVAALEGAHGVAAAGPVETVVEPVEGLAPAPEPMAEPPAPHGEVEPPAAGEI